MKKIVAMVSSILMLITLLLPISASAASATGQTLSPSISTVRNGDTLVLTYYFNGSDINNVATTLSYDSNKLEFIRVDNVKDGWRVSKTNNKIVSDDSDNTHTLNGNSALFKLTFRVLATQGANIEASLTSTSACNADGIEVSISSPATYSATVAPPVTQPPQVQPSGGGNVAPPKTTVGKTGNANLATMTIDGVSFSPAFKPSVTKYTASVDFNVDKLNIQGSTEDPTSQVKMSSTKLAVGTNTIKITVTATGGASKVYTITVTRAQDPNAPTTTASVNKDNKLSALSVEGFVLSPAFDPAVKKYIVWLPYETENLNIAGTAVDSKATVKVEGGTNLVAGKENKIKVICTAQDGSKQTYEIIAMRAPKSGTYQSQSVAVSGDNDSKSGTPVWLTILLCVLFAGGGFGIAWFVFNKKNNNYNDPNDDDFNGGLSGDDFGPDDDLDGPQQPKFKGIFFPSTTSTVDDYDDIDEPEEVSQVAQPTYVPQQPAYTPPAPVVASQTVAPTASASVKAPAQPAPTVTVTPPVAPQTSANSQTAPIDPASLGLPYTPAGGTQGAQAPASQANAQPQKRVIPKNPFEMSADD